jgi:hypothetical protein|uniref:Uncharacterized protein n=1 Tax=viral metagenome TaxID=1070528 RepID=A0A6C0JNY3_9ZZZZ
MRRLLLILLSLNSILSFNLFSIIYPIKNTFNKLNKDWNFKNKLFPSNNLNDFFIGKWYYYSYIDFIENKNNIINNPNYLDNNIVLSFYKYSSDNIKTTKIFNKSTYLLNHYKKQKRYYDNYKQYSKNENAYVNRILMLKNTDSNKLLDRNANILRTIIVRPYYCSISLTPYIPNNTIVDKLRDKTNLNNTNYNISFNIWLKEELNDTLRTGLYLSYDGINGNLKDFILKKENKINKTNINDKINLDELSLTNYTKPQNIKDFDNDTTINYIILRNNWLGNYRIQYLLHNNTDTNQITWAAEHNYFIAISNNEINKYYQLKFDDGIYINVPKNLNLFSDKDKIYIEFVCFFKNGTGIQRFLAWGTKNEGGFNTYCSDIWNNKNNIYIV